MKCENWQAFDSALKALQWNKNKIMELAYGKQYSGIDTAIPQYWIDKEQPFDTFYLVTDCTSSLYRGVDLRDLIPDFIAKKVIRASEIIGEVISNHNLEESEIRRKESEYDYIKEYLDIYKEMLNQEEV